MWPRLLDWLDSRTGYRGALAHLLDERLPHGTGWAFTTGSVILLLLGIQAVSGVVLAMYYVPSPALAYDSVRFVMRELPMGWMVRGLHVWGASFLVVATVVHLLRVFFSAGYKAPREVTWLTGLAAFLVILGFSLSGYLLPWDQRAYWATTVTINVARTTPLAGELLASLLRGGPELGALTLGRWYAVHVFVLPAVLALFAASHLVLMRRHSVSGPLRQRSGPRLPFFPWHVMKDTVVMGLVFASLIAMTVLVTSPLEPLANPADASYVPRPEWYFLSLFQLLKYLPGPLELVATQVIPGLTIGFLALLPFLDRHPERRPWAARRLPFTIGMIAIGVAVTTLTALGLKDRPSSSPADVWGLQPIAGLELATGEGSGCGRCHVAGGPAATLDETRSRRDEEWLLNHMVDPAAIAPGVRSANDRPPASVMSRSGAEAVVAYLRLSQAGIAPPAIDEQVRLAALTFASACTTCHRLSGSGGSIGPDLTFVGRRRDAAGIRVVIEDASAVYGDSAMPAFKGRLTGAQIEALASVLANRR